MFDFEFYGGLVFYEVIFLFVFLLFVREREFKIWFVGVFVKSFKFFYKYFVIKLDMSVIYNFKFINWI